MPDPVKPSDRETVTPIFIHTYVFYIFILIVTKNFVSENISQR